MKSIRVLGLSLGCCVLIGCMHTVVGGRPVQSPDGRYRLGIRVHGAGGKAYIAMTRKRVYLRLVSNTNDNPTTYIDKKYVLKAADLGWDVDWHGSDAVSVNFYDYGDGILESDASKAGTPSNHVATLTFQWNALAKKFVEKR